MTRFGCVGFSMYVCGFSVPQMQQFWLFTYPPRSKWASSEKMIFFAKIGIFCTSIASPAAYTQPYSFGGRIKLIICQIRHELSVTIHEICTRNCDWDWLDCGPYICSTFFNNKKLLSTSNIFYFRPIWIIRMHFFVLELKEILANFWVLTPWS